MVLAPLGPTRCQEVCASRAKDPLDINATVFEKTVVLCGEDGIDEGSGHLIEANNASALLAELAN